MEAHAYICVRVSLSVYECVGFRMNTKADISVYKYVCYEVRKV